MGTLRTYGTYETYGIYSRLRLDATQWRMPYTICHMKYGIWQVARNRRSLYKSHKSHSDTHRILILGPSAAGYQLQNVLRAPGGAFNGHPSFQFDEGLDSRSDHGLFDFIRNRIIFDLLAEVAPHRHSLIAVAMEERATRSGADAE